MAEQRLIDANTLKANMFLYAAPEMVWDKADIVHKIDEMPTIEERKTGKWINIEVAPFANNDGQLIYEKMCNQCGTIAYFRSVSNGCIGNNFCPNCGERMVQEGGEE